MSFSQNGRRGSYGSSRPRNNFSRNRYAPKRGRIDRSKYIHVAVEPAQEDEYQVTHQFADFGLHPQILQNISQHGYITPTPIQDQAIPALMAGRDVVGIANTGTGKTAAFLLPIIHKIAEDNDQGMLILAPTRELALQIYEECQMFIKRLPMSVALCIGGTSMGAQVSQLKRNPHIVIGTPGRVIDLIERNVLRTHMFTNIVLDEVDRMLDIGFRKDILFLISKLPEHRHAACFSATTTQETTEVMNTLLNDPVRVSVKKQETSLHIHQDIITVQVGQNKIDVLHNLLIQEEFERVIVFGRTKHGINKLEEQLYSRGVKVRSIHGNKTQSARQKSLQEFKRGRVQVLLATDIAARGIDIDDVSHVINYDEPESYEDYVHRIGRTGRAGKAGKALTFVL